MDENLLNEGNIIDTVIKMMEKAEQFVNKTGIEKKAIVLDNIKSPKIISFVIGPEGDFTDDEYNLAFKMGCIPVSLGETILKVETAAISILACANLFYDNV